MSKILEGQSRYQPSEYRQKEMEQYDNQPATFSCAFCKWSFTGKVKDARAKAQAHREKKHPETLLVRSPRRRGRALSTFRYARMDDQSIQEIEAERQKRAFLNGVELDS